MSKSQKNKNRIYVAIYFRQGITSHPELEPELGQAMYHWTIWTEKRGANGPGRFDQVQSQVQLNTAEGLIPEHWAYISREKDVSRSGGFLGRLMIGKLPLEASFHDVDAVLKPPGHPVPSGSGENCVTWTNRAIAVLQQLGWADDFDIDEFMKTAFMTAKSWYGTGNPRVWQFKNRRDNYVKARKFP